MVKLALLILSLIAGAAAQLDAIVAGDSGPRGAGRPAIDWRPIPFGEDRREQTEAYAERHYGFSTWRLRRPEVIVEHMAVTDSEDAVYDIFASNQPDADFGELPGVCTHFLVTESKVVQFVRTDTMCRHVVGLNFTAIGIEHTGSVAPDVLDDRHQLRASVRLTHWLTCRFDIRIGNVIGHKESVRSPFYVEHDPEFRAEPTHTDWPARHMDIYRRKLRRMGACPS